jgi:hypothetical protein
VVCDLRVSAVHESVLPVMLDFLPIALEVEFRAVVQIVAVVTLGLLDLFERDFHLDAKLKEGVASAVRQLSRMLLPCVRPTGLT